MTAQNLNKSLILLSLLICGSLGAQNLNQEIVTVGERELRVKEVYKQAFFPTEEDTVVEKRDVEYSIDPVFYPTQYTPDNIPAARLRIIEPLGRLNRFYTRGAVGNYTTTLFDFYYNSLRNRKSSLSLAYNHFASNGAIKSLPNEGAFSDNKLAMDFRYFNKKFRTNSVVNYHRIKRNIVQAETLEADSSLSQMYDSEQFYHLIETGIQAEKLQLNEKELGFKFDGNFKLANFYDTQEYRIVSKIYGTKKINNETFSLGISGDYNQVDNSVGNKSFILAFDPNVHTQTDNFDITAGLSLQSLNYNSSSKFSFFPNIKVRATKWDEYIVPYLELTGNYEQNTVANILTVNPFIAENINVAPTKNKLQIVVGARTSITDKSKLNVKVSHRNIEDAQFFEQQADSIYETQGFVYNTKYSDATWTKISADFSYNVKEDFRLIAEFIYNKVDLKNGDISNFIPEFESKINLQYLIKKKIIVDLTGRIMSRRQAQLDFVDNGGIGITQTSELDAILDLGTKVEYRYNKKVSAFVQANNLLAQDYLLYNGYPAQKFMIMGGFTFRF